MALGFRSVWLNFRVLCLGALLVYLLPGCDGGTALERTARLRVVHAAEVNTLDFYVDFSVVARSQRYGAVSPYATVGRGQRFLEVRTRVDGVPLTFSRDVLLDADSSYTAVVTGLEASPQLLLFTDDRTVPPAGQARLRMIHIATGIDPIDFSISPASTSATSDSSAVRDLGFGDRSAYFALEAGFYDLAVEDVMGNRIAIQDSVVFEPGRRYDLLITTRSDPSRLDILQAVDG